MPDSCAGRLTSNCGAGILSSLPTVDKPHLDVSMQWLNFKVKAWSAII